MNQDMNLELFVKEAEKKPLSESFNTLVDSKKQSGYTHELLGVEYVRALLQKPENKSYAGDVKRMKKYDKIEYQLYLRAYFGGLAYDLFNNWLQMRGIWQVGLNLEDERSQANDKFKQVGGVCRVEHSVLDLIQDPLGFELLGKAVQSGARNYVERPGVEHLLYAEYNAIYSAIRKEVENRKIEKMVLAAK